ATTGKRRSGRSGRGDRAAGRPSRPLRLRDRNGSSCPYKGRSTFAAGTALDAPFRTLPPALSQMAQSGGFVGVRITLYWHVHSCMSAPKIALNWLHISLKVSNRWYGLGTNPWYGL